MLINSINPYCTIYSTTYCKSQLSIISCNLIKRFSLSLNQLSVATSKFATSGLNSTIISKILQIGKNRIITINSKPNQLNSITKIKLDISATNPLFTIYLSFNRLSSVFLTRLDKKKLTTISTTSTANATIITKQLNNIVFAKLVFNLYLSNITVYFTVCL